MSDFIKGRARAELEDLADNIAMTSRMRREDALGILLVIGFYEERYGPKPHIYDSMISLANKGCSPEHILACIKLLPGARKDEYQSVSSNAIETARRVLNGEGARPEFESIINSGKRAVDL